MLPERETPDADCSGPGVILKYAYPLSWDGHAVKPHRHHRVVAVDKWWVRLKSLTFCTKKSSLPGLTRQSIEIERR